MITYEKIVAVSAEQVNRFGECYALVRQDTSTMLRIIEVRWVRHSSDSDILVEQSRNFSSLHRQYFARQVYLTKK